MHELSLAGGIVQLVEESAAREAFERVKRLRLEAGALSGVDVHALRFALDACTPGTCLEGAQIDIDAPPAPAWCMGCLQPVTVRSRLDDCPACGSPRVQATGGTELRVLELEVYDKPPAGQQPWAAPAQSGTQSAPQSATHATTQSAAHAPADAANVTTDPSPPSRVTPEQPLPSRSPSCA